MNFILTPDDVKYQFNSISPPSWMVRVPYGNKGNTYLYMDKDGNVTLECDTCAGHSFTVKELYEIIIAMNDMKRFYDNFSIQNRWKGQAPQLSIDQRYAEEE